MRFHIYEHWRPDSGSCFYVGKGGLRRARDMTTRNNWHKRIVAKLAELGLKPEVRIVHSTDDEHGCFAMEVQTIARHRESGAELCNLTAGGLGIYKPSDETRVKLRARNKGRKASPETRARIGAAHRGMKRPPGTGEKISAAKAGHKFTPEHRAKLTAAKLGKERAPHTAETKAKMRATAKGRKFSEAHCEALSAAAKRRRSKEKDLRHGYSFKI